MKMIKYEDYHISTFASIRETLVIKDIPLELTDKQLFSLYHEWSETYFCAGWITPNERIIHSFIEWATHSPIDLLRVERERQENES